MVLTVFRSRLRPENAEDFQMLADKMLELAQSMPGFISYKRYLNEDGERCSIVEFETPEQLLAWREHPMHREAQRMGRERYYQEYSLHVFEKAIRESRFQQGAPAVEPAG
jgi:heme-degrading monooxygenase HmoA